MSDWFATFFARRYALGGFLLVGLVIVFTWKFIQVGVSYPMGLVRTYAALLVLFSPWFLMTYFTRLRVAGDQVSWREFPFARAFSLDAVTATTRVDAGEPDSIPRLRIEYTHRGSKRRANLTPFIFPKADARAFLQALAARRPDLNVPDFPMDAANASAAHPGASDRPR